MSLRRLLPAALLLCMTTALPAKPETLNRAEIPDQYKWDFTPIYASWDAWEAGMKELEGKMDAFAALKGTLASGPQALLDAYRRFDDIGMRQYRVYGYVMLQRDVDTRDNAIGGRFQRVQALFARFGTTAAWFTPELLTIPEATVRQWIEKTPELAIYRFPILENFRLQKHVLDEKGERLLSLASQLNSAPRDIFQELSTSDIKFPKVTLSDGKEVTLTPGAYQQALQRRSQADRALAFENYIKTYSATANTYASIYNSVLQRDWFVAQARNHATTLEAALEGNAIPKAVVENLIATTKAGVEPLQRYLKLRKRLLKLDSYHLYDNFVSIYEGEKTYAYADAQRIVLESVAPLGADYVAKYRQFLGGRKVDVWENTGKRSGAYCMGVYGVGPYLLLNYNETLDAVFTFAHEAGHGMHTVLSYETQPFVTSDYTIFVAEVASTTNERFLLKKLLAETTDPKERFLLLQHAVDSIVGTYYTQVLFAAYELEAHRRVERGEPITAEVLSEIYYGLLKDFYGDSVTLDDAYKFTWCRIPHFFNSPYYVYQYATCFASSAQIFKTLTTGTEAERQAATERYLALLRAGGNDHPMEQLRKAGVDLTKPDAIRAVIDQMTELVTQLEQEAEKIEAKNI
ncbi:oligoendopeptidase F [Nibricoccus sp. IMCC34717]|uniref:oligoendopeptidase F n=1 Tax=Nibricoccus sp. IMCC34717 TaxID=3034021 RepID=UPI003850E607